jgi:3-oxoacyl-[acyl-carrier protein] reductase
MSPRPDDEGERMDLGIGGRRAAVAAASKGLGFGVAQALVAEGVHVAICGRDADTIRAAADALGHDTVPLVADVSTVAGAEGFVREARAALGGVDILVTNAGGPPPGNFAHTTVDQYLEAFELNCRGAIAMCYAAVPEMRAQGWGRVVAITSIAVRQPIADLILSNTARAGLTGFLRTLAREVAADGVTVNSLLPGLHRTERITSLYGDDAAHDVPAGAIGEPADFGSYAAFLCSVQARYVTGTATQVDGGAYAGLL